MLVDRQLILMAVVLPEIGAEPVRERRVDLLNGLAKIAARQGSATASRLHGDHDREPRVDCASPERCLAETRMAHDGDLAAVDLGCGFEIIKGPAQAPRPRSDRAPLVGSRANLAPLVKERVNPVLEPVVIIRVNVAIVKCRQCVAAGKDSFDWPA